MTRTGNRPINTLIGGEESLSRTGSGDFIRDLLFGGGGGGGGDGGEDQEELDYYERLYRQLIDDLMKPLDLNDPLVQNILTGARTATLADLSGRGIQGGYSENQAQQAYINAAAQLQGQRQARALQALGQGSGYGLQREQQDFARQQYDYENDPARGWGAGIGGALGALGGGLVGSVVPGVGTLAGVGLGSQVGSQLGAGIGGQFARRPTSRRRVAGGY
jgi:hypothetical protein